MTLTRSLCASVLLGLVQGYAAAFAWSWIVFSSPVVPWLLDAGLHDQGLINALLPIGLLMGIVLALPSAWLLGRLISRRLPLHLAMATLPWALWESAALITSEHLASSWSIQLSGILLPLLSIPLAFLLVRMVVAPSNNKASAF